MPTTRTAKQCEDGEEEEEKLVRDTVLTREGQGSVT
jgi:hypothetical protein